MRFRLASRNWMKAAASLTRMCRPGSVRGAGSVSERHLARDRRLVAARDPSPD